MKVQFTDRQYQLIQTLPAAERGAVLAAFFDFKFNQENQVALEKLEKNQQAVFLKMLARNWGGAREKSGRKPRKSGKVQKKNIAENENQDNQENQVALEKLEKNQSRVVDNNILNINNINISPEKKIEKHTLTGMQKEKEKNPRTKWDLAMAEWNRIAGLYRRPKVRAITPQMQTAILARCADNKIRIGEFFAICEKALMRDPALRNGTDKWGGADLIYFTRPANFTRALQAADNPDMKFSRGDETAAVLADFIKGGDNE